MKLIFEHFYIKIPPLYAFNNILYYKYTIFNIIKLRRTITIN